jgi:CheY-like chemotaxis protein
LESHELRTPLNSILGFAQLLGAGTPPPSHTQKRSIDRILKAGWYLLTLVNEILDLSHIESGKLALSQEPVALASLLIECHFMIEEQAQERGIALSFPPVDTPYVLSADRTRLQQVLLNLLSNAVKYNRPGGVVRVECRAVGPDRLHISVGDTGQGLTPSELGQLFQPFNRLGREADVKEGTGIGLVVTKQLVEMMGGRIHVESTVGVGTRFTIDLRLSKVQVVDPALLEPAVAARAPESLGAPVRTLLYVEDNPDNLDLIEHILSDRPDLHLLTAQAGELGMELALKHQPALILMDLNLPGITGTDAMKRLRADPATAHIPIIALSANAMPQDIKKAIEAGFSGYITKPFEIPQLLEGLDAALRMAATVEESGR